LKVIVNEGRKLPDGLVIDDDAGHIYWTNMGNPKKDDGSIFRSDLDGKSMIAILPPAPRLRLSRFSSKRRVGSSTGPIAKACE